MTTISYNRSTSQWQDQAGVAAALNESTFVDGSPFVQVGTNGTRPDGQAWTVVRVDTVNGKQMCLLVWINATAANTDYLPLEAVQGMRLADPSAGLTPPTGWV